ncbi:DUF3329 domain-containing protein, partial [Clostridium beijerinckii]|uniref:DUF3329 domain-containing protein n=1 Tax=Clostridium beijerinckii TaxID=1520 RepID=UPI00098CC8D6
RKFINVCKNIDIKYFTKYSIRKNVFISSIIFFSIAMFILNYLTPLLVDDYSFGYINGTETHIVSIKDIIYSMYNYYFTWGGRVWGEFYQQLFTLLGKPIFNVLNTIIYIVNTLLIYYACNEAKKAKVSLYIGINLLIWFFTPNYGQVMFWLSGSSNYLWLITPVLIMILIFRKYSINQDIIKNNLISAFIIFVLGILAGWANENASAGMLVILTLYIAYYYVNNISICRYIISGYIGSLIGFILLISAPGAYVRKAVEQSAVHTTIIFRLFMITYFWVAFVLGMFIILAIVLFIGKRYFDLKKNNSIYQSVIFVMASIGSAYGMIASPTSPERTWFCIVVYLSISIGILYEKIDFEVTDLEESTILMFRRIAVAVMLIAFCNFWVMYLDAIMSTYEVLNQTKAREQYILSEKLKGKLDISTVVISHKYPLLAHHDASYGLDDITPDPNYFSNKALCKYYGLNSIIGVPAKEKQYLN